MSEVPQQNANDGQPVFSIEKLYVKDLSLEIPNAPQVFLERNAPQVDIQLHHGSKGVEDGVYETSLTVTDCSIFGSCRTATCLFSPGRIRTSVSTRVSKPGNSAWTV